MTENTTDTLPSSLSPQEEQDEIKRRSATLVKATSRLEEIAGYLERIDGAIASVLPEIVAVHPLGAAIDGFALLEDQANAAEKQIKAVLGRLAYAREVSFPARFDAEEAGTFTSSETGHRMTRTSRIFASMTPDHVVPDGGVVTVEGTNLDEALAGEYPTLIGCPLGFVWLIKNGYEPLIKPTVNASSLSAAAKEIMENGREMPEDLFRLHTKDNVSLTRKKSKV